MKPGEVLEDIERKIQEKGYSYIEPRFWGLVNEIKKDPELTARYAERVGMIDQGIFREKAVFTMPVPLGNLLAIIGVAASAGLLAAGAGAEGVYPGLFSVAAALILSTAVHPLAHIAAGRLAGMRFTFYFPNGPIKIEPTVKVDYGTYLKSSPGQRVMMHIAGPAATALSPLAVMVAAYTMGYPVSALYAPAALFLFFLFTEFIPLLLVRAGSPKFLGVDFRKSDTYRALREKGLL